MGPRCSRSAPQPDSLVGGNHVLDSVPGFFHTAGRRTEPEQEGRLCSLAASYSVNNLGHSVSIVFSVKWA